MDSSNQPVTIDLDAAVDVLYVRRRGRQLVTSRTYDDDGVVLNLDAEGQVSGLQIVFVSELFGDWNTHPDRVHIPPELLTVVDGWFSAHAHRV